MLTEKKIQSTILSTNLLSSQNANEQVLRKQWQNSES